MSLKTTTMDMMPLGMLALKQCLRPKDQMNQVRLKLLRRLIMYTTKPQMRFRKDANHDCYTSTPVLEKFI